MYSREQVRRALNNPLLFPYEIKRQFWIQTSRLSRVVFDRNDPPLPDCDWDNLLLLDACRYDLFKECSTLPGELQTRYSVASNTAEYVTKTFKDNEYPEIVCVTSTPKYYKPNVEDSFHDIIHVWDEHWDDDHRTVLPDVMNDAVQDAVKSYPNKRILAHYIPPHVPFIGQKGQEIPHEVVFCGDVIRMDTDAQDIWDSLEDGTLDHDTVWNAYRENLEIALDAVNEILPELPGKTAVTSDHGNAFGELGVYGHPPYRHIKPLIQVPWLEYENGPRKEIQAGDIQNNVGDFETDLVNDRLSDLGYVE